MCRSEAVQIVRTRKIWRSPGYNGRLVIEVDPAVHDDVIFSQIRALLAKSERRSRGGKISMLGLSIEFLLCMT